MSKYILLLTIFPLYIAQLLLLAMVKHKMALYILLLFLKALQLVVYLITLKSGLLGDRI
jgi:hypothetical protein